MLNNKGKKQRHISQKLTEHDILLRGESAWKRQNYQEAIEYFSSINIDNTHFYTLFMEAVSHLILKQVPQFKRLYNRIQDHYKENVYSATLEVFLSLKQDRHDKAVDRSESCVKKYPSAKKIAKIFSRLKDPAEFDLIKRHATALEFIELPARSFRGIRQDDMPSENALDKLNKKNARQKSKKDIKKSGIKRRGGEKNKKVEKVNRDKKMTRSTAERMFRLLYSIAVLLLIVLAISFLQQATQQGFLNTVSGFSEHLQKYLPSISLKEILRLRLREETKESGSEDQLSTARKGDDANEVNEDVPRANSNEEDKNLSFLQKMAKNMEEKKSSENNSLKLDDTDSEAISKKEFREKMEKARLALKEGQRNRSLIILNDLTIKKMPPTLYQELLLFRSIADSFPAGEETVELFSSLDDPQKFRDCHIRGEGRIDRVWNNGKHSRVLLNVVHANAEKGSKKGPYEVRKGINIVLDKAIGNANIGRDLSFYGFLRQDRNDDTKWFIQARKYSLH